MRRKLGVRPAWSSPSEVCLGSCVASRCGQGTLARHWFVSCLSYAIGNEGETGTKVISQGCAAPDRRCEGLEGPVAFEQDAQLTNLFDIGDRVMSVDEHAVPVPELIEA